MKAQKKYDNPYLQAQYVYSQIGVTIPKPECEAWIAV